MAVFCYLIGSILLLGCTGGGWFLTKVLMGNSIYRVTFGLNSFSQPWMPYAIIVGACFIIGLLFFLSWLFTGINCARIKKLSRRKKKQSAAE